MKKNLIPAYNWESVIEEGGFVQEPERLKYIESSVNATETKEVRKYLKNYINENNCCSEVKTFLQLFLDNIGLLQKTQVVWDGSYRNCVIVVKPDNVMVTHSGGYYEINPNHTIEELLSYFLDNAETIFLNIHTTTHAQDMEDWALWDDMDDDYYYEDNY